MISRLVGGDLLLLCLRANRNLFRARSRILESYNDRGICCVGAGFPNRCRPERLLGSNLNAINSYLAKIVVRAPKATARQSLQAAR